MSLIDVEQLIAPKHPIRATKRMCDEALARMSAHFDEIYAADGAPSVPPETLLKGKVLQALFTVRSNQQLCARLQTDLMFVTYRTIFQGNKEMTVDITPLPDAIKSTGHR